MNLVNVRARSRATCKMHSQIIGQQGGRGDKLETDETQTLLYSRDITWSRLSEDGPSTSLGTVTVKHNAGDSKIESEESHAHDVHWGTKSGGRGCWTPNDIHAFN